VSIFWLIFGFAGQTLFFMRFVVQWISSERQKKSVIPVAFWYFSISGGVTLLTYAIYRQDPVFILGQSIGLFVYLRNLHLIANEKRKNNPDAHVRSPMAIVAPIIAAVIVIGGGVHVWDQYFKDHIIIRNFGVVEPGKIYRAGRQTPETMRKIHDRYNIRTIVDLGVAARGSERDEQADALANELGIDRHRMDNLLGDATGNPNEYVAALRMMNDDSNYPMLIQCGAGAQRTGLAVILYRHLFEGVPLKEAHIESFKFGHDPDEWIMLSYLAEHYAEIKTALDTNTWIPGYPIPIDSTDQKTDAPPPSPAGASVPNTIEPE
jgi:lipid-A-disaccharide synthase-like uncharacterized protein